MWICDGHHIRPVSEGGPTNIDNMMLLCWVCHQKVHHHRWRVVPDGRGLYTIAPPEQIRYETGARPRPAPAAGGRHRTGCGRPAARGARLAPSRREPQTGLNHPYPSLRVSRRSPSHSFR